jgi:hypothetical protein
MRTMTTRKKMTVTMILSREARLSNTPTAQYRVRLIAPSLIKRFQIADRLPSPPIALPAEAIHIHRQSPHVFYGGHTRREEYPFVVLIIPQTFNSIPARLFYNPTVDDAPHAVTDSLGSAWTEFEPPTKNSRAPIAEGPQISLEIPATILENEQVLWRRTPCRGPIRPRLPLALLILMGLLARSLNLPNRLSP